MRPPSPVPPAAARPGAGDTVPFGNEAQALPGPDAARGAVEALLNNDSVVRGALLPFRDTDAIVQIAMDGSAAPPVRLRRELLRVLKLAGEPAIDADASPHAFRFEFSDGKVLAGDCVDATSRPRGTWLRVVLADGGRETWFVDTRECLRAEVDGDPLSRVTAAQRRHAPARPDSAEALWTMIESARPPLEQAPELGEALLLGGWIDAETLARVVAVQRLPGEQRPLERVLVDEGCLSEVQLRMAQAEWMGLRVIDPADLRPGPGALAMVPRAIAERSSVLPLMLHGDALVLLCADPWDKPLLDELRFATQRRVVPVMAVPGTLMPAIHRAYEAQQARAQAATESPEALAAALSAAPEAAERAEADVVTEADSTLVRLINSVIAEAIRRHASDIHVETADAPRQVRIRLRVDGELVELLHLPPRLRFAIVARIKIMADLDIAEHRKPQDGKIDFARFGGPHVELRVVTVPTSRGLEDVVLRLLSGLKPLPLDDIGLGADNLAALRRVASQPYGLILICGPTGCGKTTTLHSLMRELNTASRKIWTAEDPIEITQDGLRQVQMNPRIGWTFAAAMRTFLRADPDVIMIGEMRDEETARIAIEASLTGHLVLSTLHTNSAPESIARLLEIGLDPFNFSDSLLAILAQRLVRRLCTHCREAEPAADDELDAMAAHYLGGAAAADPGRGAALVARWRDASAGPVRLWRRRGCDRCDGHGYSGRLGIHELMLADETVRRQIRRRESAEALQATALGAGMKTLRQDGIDKVLAGLTDLAEVIAATKS
jgi:type II secretory ATPase GspE/PulE/Tfp pilus assembly ATPase PilB-like protein